MNRQSGAVQRKVAAPGSSRKAGTKQTKAELAAALRAQSRRRQAIGLYGAVLAATFGMLLIMFISREIYPFGDKVLRYTDGDQYFGILGYVQNTLLSSDDLLYTWGSVLGGNMIPLLAYYGASPFNLLTVFFPGNLMLAYHVILMLKFLAAAVSFAVMLNQVFPEADNKAKLLFAVSYPFIGYMTYFIWNQTWMDGVIVLPIIALGIWLILKESRPLLYAVALAAMLISNYYIGYMIGIASVLLFACGAAVLWKRSTDLLRAVGWYAGATGIAVGLAAIILVPAFLSLPSDRMATAAELWDNISYLCQPEEVLSMLYTAPLGDMDFSNNYPIIYTGIVQLVLVVVFFFNREVSGRAKAVASILLLVLMLSFMISIINVAWHGFTENLWYNFRYSFVASFVIEFLAFCSFTHLTGAKKILPAAGAAAALITLLALQADKENLGAATLTFDAVCIAAALVLFHLYITKLEASTQKAQRLCFLLIAALTLGSIVCNTYQTTDGLGDWYAARNGLGSLQEYEDAVQRERVVATIISDPELYRRASVQRYGRTDALLFGYAGVENYSSAERANALAAARNLGLSQDSGWAIYNTNVPLAADALLGVKYLILGDATKTDYLEDKGHVTTTDLTVWKNPYALPILFPAEHTFSQDGETLNTLDLLNACWNSVNSIGGDIFRPATFSLEESPTEEGTDILLWYRAETDGPMYAYIPAGDYKADLPTWTHHQDVVELGSFAAGEEGEVLLHMGQAYDGTECIHVYTEQVDILAEKASAVQKRSPQVEQLNSSRLRLQCTAVTDGLIASTIPFDEGWHVYLDGSEAETVRDMNWFLAFELPAGEHEIELVYWPPGLWAGAALSAASLAVVLLYAFRRRLA